MASEEGERETTHEIVRVTAKTEFEVVRPKGSIASGSIRDISNHVWHCSCGDSFEAKDAAEDHESEMP